MKLQSEKHESQMKSLEDYRICTARRNCCFLQLKYIFLGFPLLAISTNFIQMIIARTTQRIGKSLFPTAFDIMRDKFEPEKIAVAQGIFVSMFSVGCSNTSGHRWCLLNLICNLFEPNFAQ